MMDGSDPEWIPGTDDESGFSLCCITHQEPCSCEQRVGRVVCASIRNSILRDRPRLDMMRAAMRGE